MRQDLPTDQWQWSGASARRYQTFVALIPSTAQEACRLRYQVFAGELGAHLPGDGIDQDRFDSFCDHLVFRDQREDWIVATTRLLSDAAAQRSGGFYSQQEFDLDTVLALQGRFLEVGRGGLILLWLSSGALILVAVFPWLRALDTKYCTAIRLAWFRGLAHLLRLRLEVTGTTAPGPVLIVANHISWLDVVVLGYQTPVTFVAKAEVARWPLIRLLARRSGTLFIHRGNLRTLRGLTRAIAQRLRAGERVAIFPEGTTTTGRQVLPFNPALLQAAIDAAVPVQPVTLRYAGTATATAPFVGEDTFIDSLRRILRLPEVAVHCCWHAPLHDKRRRHLANRARDHIAAVGVERTDFLMKCCPAATSKARPDRN